MSNKTIIVISLLLIAIVIGKWIFDSIDYNETLIFSREKKAIVTKSTDDLFGTEVETTEWVDGFWLGLLPGEDKISSGILFGVVPIASIIAFSSIIIIIINRKRKQSRNKL